MLDSISVAACPCCQYIALLANGGTSPVVAPCGPRAGRKNARRSAAKGEPPNRLSAPANDIKDRRPHLIHSNAITQAGFTKQNPIQNPRLTAAHRDNHQSPKQRTGHHATRETPESNPDATASRKPPNLKHPPSPLPASAHRPQQGRLRSLYSQGAQYLGCEGFNS